MSRKEFADYWNSEQTGMGDSGSPLWVPEEHFSSSIKCNYFIYAKIVHGPNWDKNVFWEWVKYSLRGQMRCFSADNNGEWWGFTNKDDIPVALLRWA